VAARFRHQDDRSDDASVVAPEDVLRDASKRLMFTGWIAIVVVLANAALDLVGRGVTLVGMERFFAVFAPIGVTVASLMLVVYVRGHEFTARRMYWTGLGYAALVVLITAFRRHAGPWDVDDLGGWSEVAVIILLLPVLIPTSPERAAAAGLVLSVMDMLGYWVSIVLGTPPLDAAATLSLFRTDFVAIFIAYAIAHVVAGLRKKITDARRLGSYELIERLGEGGMGEVWRGRHAMLARPAAIKLIRREALQIQDPVFVDTLLRRFEREAQATAMLRSPHTVELYDFGTTDDGSFYYVMEHLTGMDLHDLVADHGAIRPARAINILRQVCLSLDEAHAAGLTHRDIKPNNIFLCSYGREDDFVKVLDFGLVKEQSDVGDSMLTEADAITGTPAFMAPEQARGKDVDERTDIYAVGCVAYWLLVGHFPFRGTVSEMLIAHATEKPKLVSEGVKGALPAGLDELVAACLEKDPADRPQSMLDLIERLNAIVTDDEWTPEDATKWWDEHVRGQTS
jgi:serine/threonine-protein kinase